MYNINLPVMYVKNGEITTIEKTFLFQLTLTTATEIDFDKFQERIEEAQKEEKDLKKAAFVIQMLKEIVSKSAFEISPSGEIVPMSEDERAKFVKTPAFDHLVMYLVEEESGSRLNDFFRKVAPVTEGGEQVS